MSAMIGRIQATPGNRDALAAALADGMEDMPGCLMHLVAVEPEDADGVWISECWVDEAAHADWLATDETQALIARIAPLFNSAAPIVAIAGLVAFGSRQIWGAMLLGGLAGPFMMVGYYATAYLMDFDTSAEWAAVWISVGVVFGVLMGFSTWLMRAYVDVVWRAIGAAFWPAVAIGEAWHHLARAADTSEDMYWWVQAGIGAFVMLVLAGWRVPTWTARLVTLVLTAIGAALVYIAYGEASAF